VAIVAYAGVFIQQKSDLPGDMTFCGNIQLKLLPNMLQLCPFFATSLRKTIICQFLQKKLMAQAILVRRQNSFILVRR
jgi:hypothetical protein